MTCADETKITCYFEALSQGGEVRIPLDTYSFSKKFVWVQRLGRSGIGAKFCEVRAGSPPSMLNPCSAHHAERDGYVAVTLRVTSRFREINTNGGEPKSRSSYAYVRATARRHLVTMCWEIREEAIKNAMLAQDGLGCRAGADDVLA